MHLLLFLLLIAPAHAHHIDEAYHLSGTEICAAVADELDHGVYHGLIKRNKANDLIIRCFVNYN